MRKTLLGSDVIKKSVLLACPFAPTPRRPIDDVLAIR
jgi:hypothetical protein